MLKLFCHRHKNLVTGRRGEGVGVGKGGGGGWGDKGVEICSEGRGYRRGLSGVGVEGHHVVRYRVLLAGCVNWVLW